MARIPKTKSTTAHTRIPLSPAPSREITSRTRRQSHQQSLLGEKLDEISLFRWRSFHEIFPLGIQSRHLEDIEHIMDVKFRQTMGNDRPGEIGMTVKVVGIARQHLVHVWVAARAEQVVASASPFVDAVGAQ